MFGDKLTKVECENLIENLKMCSAPFQCAHGRPSVAPIIKLDKFVQPSKVSKLNFSKFNVISF